MTATGFYLMSRGWMDHPALVGREAFSRREAWLWMIEQAHWQPRGVSIGGKTVDIGRGQFCHSYRFMAKAWGWEIGRVQRFIGRLVTDGMIGVSIEHGQTLLTLCNYDKYQGQQCIADTPIDTDPIRERYATDTKKKQGKQDKKEEPVANATVVRSATKSSSIDESEFQEFYDAYPLHKARGAALKAYLSARKKDTSHENLVRGAARYADCCRRSGTEKRFIAHPSTWLNEQRWLDDLSDDRPAGARPGRSSGGYRQGGRSDVEIIADLVAEAERKEQGGELRLGDDNDGFFSGLRVVSI